MAANSGRPRFFVFVAASIAVLVGATHHAGSVCVLYLAPYLGYGLVLGAFIVAVVAGALGSIVSAQSSDRAASWLAASAFGVLALELGSFATFDSSMARAVPMLLGGSVAVFLGAAAASFALAFGRVALSLGIVPFWMNPFRLLAAGAALGASAVVAADLGALRQGLSTAAALALVSTWAAGEYRWVFARAAPASRRTVGASHVLVLGVAAAAAAAEDCVPWHEVASFPDPVVFASGAGKRRYVLTSTASGFELYTDGQLEVASLDATRYFEALVQPAMGAHAAPRRVALLEGGSGLAEHEILRCPTVRSVVVVLSDAELARLGRGVPWLRERSDFALDDPKIQLVPEEPIAWLERARGPFDVVVADLPAPTGYLEGKNYTRYFWTHVAALLDSDGIVVAPATSAVQAPSAYATIRATLVSSGLSVTEYHVPIPTLGLWSFLLGSRRAIDPKRIATLPGRFLNANAVAGLFKSALDTRPPAQPPSRLDDQRAVDAFRRERLLPE